LIFGRWLYLILHMYQLLQASYQVLHCSFIIILSVSLWVVGWVGGRVGVGVCEVCMTMYVISENFLR
jgi:hypothetical protein